MCEKEEVIQSKIDERLYNSTCAKSVRYFSKYYNQYKLLKSELHIGVLLLATLVILYTLTEVTDIFSEYESKIKLLMIIICGIVLLTMAHVCKLLYKVDDIMNIRCSIFLEGSKMTIFRDNGDSYFINTDSIYQVRYSKGGHILFVDCDYISIHRISDIVLYSQPKTGYSRVIPMYYDNEGEIVEKLMSLCGDKFKVID